jgi:hypothetical protein
MKTPITMLMSLLLALGALACTNGPAIDGEGAVINPALPPDCVQVTMEDGESNPFERERPTAAKIAAQFGAGYMAVRVYACVDSNTMKFLGWEVMSVSTVKRLHDATRQD